MKTFIQRKVNVLNALGEIIETGIANDLRVVTRKGVKIEQLAIYFDAGHWSWYDKRDTREV